MNEEFITDHLLECVCPNCDNMGMSILCKTPYYQVKDSSSDEKINISFMRPSYFISCNKCDYTFGSKFTYRDKSSLYNAFLGRYRDE